MTRGTGVTHIAWQVGHLVMWNIRHEGLHGGQIGLLRRLLGERPYR